MTPIKDLREVVALFQNQKELKEIEGMTDSFSTNIMDIMPADLDIVKLLLPKGSAITEDQLKKIVSISEKYSK